MQKTAWARALNVGTGFGWNISRLASTGCPSENCTVFHDLGKEFILGNIGGMSWKKLSS
jgi:hypothetical protein